MIFVTIVAIKIIGQKVQKEERKFEIFKNGTNKHY